MAQITRDDLCNALPDLDAPVTSARLRRGATVVRDAWGIPHIRADDEYDLFFAQGHASAQDRLWQMDHDRLRALGRAAEQLGAGAVATDRLMRRRRLDAAARRDLALCSEATRAALEAYSDGVNAFLASAAPLPVEYRLLETRPEPWEPWHCILVYKIRNAAEGSFQGKLWLTELAAARGAAPAAHISPGYQPGQLLTVPPGQPYHGPALRAVAELQAAVEASAALRETEGGSNGWAIAGARTVSGLPLVAGDSHRALEVPNVYTQVHLVGADFAALGYTIPGMPLVMHFMHNDRVAWGMTHGGVDTQDLYVEELRRGADGGVEYRFEDGWRAATVSHETLHVRAGETESFEVIETHHGPVIAGGLAPGASSGHGIALADPGAGEATAWVDATYLAMKADSADAFEAAMAGWTDRVNNYPYADVEGNFGYTLRGRIAVRGAENGWGPVAGWTGEHEWRGIIGVDALPRARNPATGWAVTCNQRVVDDEYPYYLSHSFGPDYRARRVAACIEAGAERRLDVEDMAAIHADCESVPAGVVVPAMQDLQPTDARVAAALDVLLTWDRRMAQDSAGAAIWAATNREVNRALAREHYGLQDFSAERPGSAGAVDHLRRQLRPAFIGMIERGETHLLPAGCSLQAFLLGALERAVAFLGTRLGAEPAAWRWGDLHQVRLQHPLAAVFPAAAALLNPPVVAVAGDGDVPWASGNWPLGVFDVGVGPVNRYIHDPADWSKGRWVVPLGASGHPGSPHFADQQPLWAAVDSIPQLWHWADVEAGAETVQQFTPAPG